MVSRARKFLLLPAWQKWLLVRAWWMLGWVRMSVLRGRFKNLTADLSYCPGQSLPLPITRSAEAQAEEIGRLVAIAARYTWWQSRCLVQVLVVQRLLEKRSIPGSFYLGAAKSGANGVVAPALAAHAWLQCGEAIVSGVTEHEAFTVLATFCWRQESCEG